MPYTRVKDDIQFLAEAGKILSSSLDYNVTLASVAKLITDNMADFCMVDLLEKDGKIVRVATRVSDPKKKELAQKMFDYPANPTYKGGIYDTARTGRPILVEKVTEEWLKSIARIPGERKTHKELGTRSLIFAPLKGRNRVIGVLTIVSSKEGFSYSEDDVVLVGELANRAGLAVAQARLYREAQEAYEAEKTLASNLIFLSEASKILSSSLDYKTTLANVAKLAVPNIADWCAIDLLNENGEIEQVVVVHKDPQKVKWARQLRKERPVDMTDKTGIPQVLRTGKPELYPFIADEMLAARAKNKKELETFRNLHIASAMIVPLFSNKKTIGTISFVTSESGKQYNKDSLAMAEELATRASIAIENSRLYLVAQEAIRVRDELMSTTSHELKTPITSIYLNLETTLKKIRSSSDSQIKTKDVVKMLETGQNQIQRLSRIINELLNVSVISRGMLTLEKEKVSLSSLARETLQGFELELKKSKTKAVLKDEGSVIGYWDRVRLGQVISNLLSNAIKYGRKKPITITLKKSGRNAMIIIQDKGMGIKQERQKQMFDLFRRGVSEKEYLGLGIGLYICRQIVEAHGGNISFESKVKKGTTFTVELPLKPPPRLTRRPSRHFFHNLI